MNKREVVWLITRLIGVYFIYLAFIFAFDLISSVSTLYSVTSQKSETKSETNSTIAPVGIPENFPARQPNLAGKIPEKPALDSTSKKLADEAIKQLLWYVLLTGLYGAVGFYLIKNGRFLFAILNRETEVAEKEKEINSLNLFDEKS